MKSHDDGVRCNLLALGGLAGVESAAGITAQQLVIVRHIMERDLTSEAIARAMGISRSSVDTQLERLFRKLEVHTRTAMAVRVLTEAIAMMLEENPPVAGGVGK